MLLGALALSAVAGNRTRSQMRAIARQQLDNGMTRGGDGLKLSTLYETSALAVIGDTTAGFAVVSRDASQPPVLGVSKRPFSFSESPAAFRWWLSEMTARLNTGIPIPTRSVTSVGNFVDTHWDQNDPFNGMCPKDGSTVCPTGCVATAMSQVMKHYNYPAQGRGTGSYTIGKRERAYTVSISSAYDWGNMHTTYRSGGSTGAAAKKAVQQLMYDAGCAVNMNYSSSGSSATNLSAARAMFRNFSYDSLAIHYLYRKFYSDEEWEHIIYSELAQQRPIQYGGNDSSTGTGHAFLLTGCDEAGRVWVNWGWGRGVTVGGYDGFFEISGLKLEGNYFDASHDMVTGYRPQRNPDNQDEYTSQWGFDAPFRLTVLDDGRLEFSISNFYNLNVLCFQGMLWYNFRNTVNNQTEQQEMLDLQKSIVAPFYGYFPDEGEELISDTLSLESLAAGTYEFSIVSQARGENSMTPMRTVGGPQYATLIKAADGSITIEGQPTSVTPLHGRQPSPDNRIYSLDGRPQQHDGLPGVYIRNGRKYMRK